MGVSRLPQQRHEMLSAGSPSNTAASTAHSTPRRKKDLSQQGAAGECLLPTCTTNKHVASEHASTDCTTTSEWTVHFRQQDYTCSEDIDMTSVSPSPKDGRPPPCAAFIVQTGQPVLLTTRSCHLLQAQHNLISKATTS